VDHSDSAGSNRERQAWSDLGPTLEDDIQPYGRRRGR
jgi:hypothetical protein